MPRKTKVEKVESEESEEQETEESPTESPVKKVKVKRAPSAYNLFVKQNIGNFKDMPPRERMSAVGDLWAKEKTKK